MYFNCKRSCCAYDSQYTPIKMVTQWVSVEMGLIAKINNHERFKVLGILIYYCTKHQTL